MFDMVGMIRGPILASTDVERRLNGKVVSASPPCCSSSVCYGISQYSQWLERRWRQDLSLRRLSQADTANLKYPTKLAYLDPEYEQVYGHVPLCCADMTCGLSGRKRIVVCGLRGLVNHCSSVASCAERAQKGSIEVDARFALFGSQDIDKNIAPRLDVASSDFNLFPH